METERIHLRHWQESDAEALFKYASDPDVGPRAGWPAHKSEEVSHDRDFLDGLVTKVYEFGHGRVREHLGGIYDFLESKKLESLQELEKKR